MKTTMCLICAFVLISGVGWAHGDQIHVMGTVSKLEGDTITVATTSGSEKIVRIVPTTRFLRGESPATVQDLKVSDRVVIHAKLTGQILEATEVKIGVAKTAQQSQ
jgi:hypothetical protein